MRHATAVEVAQPVQHRARDRGENGLGERRACAGRRRASGAGDGGAWRRAAAVAVAAGWRRRWRRDGGGGGVRPTLDAHDIEEGCVHVLEGDVYLRPTRSGGRRRPREGSSPFIRKGCFKWWQEIPQWMKLASWPISDSCVK